MPENRMGKCLCYRCDARAEFLENGYGPRYECGQVNSAKYSCYMYRPVKPVLLVRNSNDNRPQFVSYQMSARSHANGFTDMHLELKEADNGSCLYWTPDEVKI